MKQKTNKSDGKPQRRSRRDGSSAANGQRSVRMVAAAMILRTGELADEVLICQRKSDQPMALKWEFPGGKLEIGESAEEALRRELNEELGIEAEIGQLVARIRHNYRNGGAVDLQFFVVRRFTGEIQNRIFKQMQWSNLTSLPEFDFLAADLGLIKDLAEGKIRIP
jgi:8-oxo-dGTP diphosphatase